MRRGQWLKGVFANTRRARNLDYRDLVRLHADGRGGSPFELYDWLPKFGRTPEQFAADVERLERRREAAKRVEEARACVGRRKAADKRMAVAQAALDRAQAAYDEVANDVANEMLAIKALEQAAWESQVFLRDSAAETVLAESHEAGRLGGLAQNEVSEAMTGLQRAKSECEAAQRQLEDVRAGRVDQISLRGYIGPAVTESACENRIAHAKTAMRQAEQRLVAAQQAYQDAQQKAEEADKALLIP